MPLVFIFINDEKNDTYYKEAYDKKYHDELHRDACGRTSWFVNDSKFHPHTSFILFSIKQKPTKAY